MDFSDATRFFVTMQLGDALTPIRLGEIAFTRNIHGILRNHCNFAIRRALQTIIEKQSINQPERVILLAGMNEVFSLPISASKPLSCARVKYRLLAFPNSMHALPHFALMSPEDFHINRDCEAILAGKAL